MEAPIDRGTAAAQSYGSSDAARAHSRERLQRGALKNGWYGRPMKSATAAPIMMRWRLVIAVTLDAVGALFSPAAAAGPMALPALNVDITETSVSGLSSGAYMAVQFEVAHSSIVKGVGVIAGGPYFCAQ